MKKVVMSANRGVTEMPEKDTGSRRGMEQVARPIAATLRTNRSVIPLHSVVMTPDGVVVNQAEVDAAFGAHVEVHDGDLGQLALWQPGNNGEPDAYVEYDEDEHDI